jgi:hypothetical protein
MLPDIPHDLLPGFMAAQESVFSTVLYRRGLPGE